MAIKGYSTIPKSPELEPHHQMQFNVITRITFWLGGINPLSPVDRLECNVCDFSTATRVQILAETNCISHSTNTLGKGMNPIIPPPAMGK